MSAPSLLIVVPVHEEEGWAVGSPGETAKARLEAKSPERKSPEELKALCEKADERAKALHQLHLDAVKRRAQRDLERVAEAERRRLRAEEAEKQRIVERAAKDDMRVSERKEALEVQAAEKRARREALKQAFFESRASIAAAHVQREHQLLERNGNAAAKRTKLLQATVHKANYEVKHAMAVATAAKEKERAEAARASSCLDERMAAASSRRLELLGSPSKSSGTESAHKTSRARARQVAQVLNDESCALEQKRKALSDAMEKAVAARSARLEARVAKAAGYKEKAERAKLAKEKAESTEGLKHSIVEKGQAAEVRRMLMLKAPSHKKMNPCFLDVSFRTREGVAAPAALVERLSAMPALIPEEIDARHHGAAARRERALFETLSRLVARAGRHDAAAARRAAVHDAREAKVIAKMGRRVASPAERAAGTVASAKKRAAAAAAKRVAARYIELGLLLCKAQTCEQAAVRRAAGLANVGAAQRKAAEAVAARRATFDAAIAARGDACAARLSRAAERRSAVLSARVARAKMSALTRATAAKLTATPDGAVSVSVIGKAPDGKEPQAAAEAAPVEKKSAEGDAPAERGLIGRIFGKVFGM